MVDFKIQNCLFTQGNLIDFHDLLTKQICLYKSYCQSTALDIIYLSIYFHFRCPDITRLYTLSEPSVNGIPLYVLEFTDNPGKHELCK